MGKASLVTKPFQRVHVPKLLQRIREVRSTGGRQCSDANSPLRPPDFGKLCLFRRKLLMEVRDLPQKFLFSGVQKIAQIH